MKPNARCRDCGAETKIALPNVAPNGTPTRRESRAPFTGPVQDLRPRTGDDAGAGPRCDECGGILDPIQPFRSL